MIATLADISLRNVGSQVDDVDRVGEGCLKTNKAVNKLDKVACSRS